VTAFLVGAGIIVAAILAVIALYTMLVSKREMVTNGWADIDVQLDATVHRLCYRSLRGHKPRIASLIHLGIHHHQLNKRTRRRGEKRKPAEHRGNHA